MISRVAAWFPHFPFCPILAAQRGKRITARWLGSGRHDCTSVDLLLLGTFGKLSVDCLHVSLNRHVRGGMRGNQTEVCVQVALGTLKLGRGELPDIVVADHFISRKQ